MISDLFWDNNQNRPLTHGHGLGLPPSGLTEAERDAWYAEHKRIDQEIADKWWDERGRANAAFYAALKGFQP